MNIMLSLDTRVMPHLTLHELLFFHISPTMRLVFPEQALEYCISQEWALW